MNKKKNSTFEEVVKETLNHKPVKLCDENGNCNGCNSCCSITSPISKDELIKLKRLFKKRHLKKFIENLMLYKDQGINDQCFFHIDGKCSIYNLRPDVCKVYHCDPKRGEGKFEFFKVPRTRFIYELLPDEWQTPFKAITSQVLKEIKKCAKI
ncbi:MAG: YkgJ family cysteine cluster protein [Cetobacterium sp.]|uniref:YkgJ family cysteine cluster protein n=1 Tax=Cetobacterium sp. TaxID=2071632 RepID=UPI003F35C25E